MSQIKDRGQYSQGEGGAGKKKSNGSKFDQYKGFGAGPSGSKDTPYKPATKSSGSKDSADVSADLSGTGRGGGTIKGHSRDNPAAGKSKSGSKFTQHPNVKTRK
jgi:hypothetical protein